MRVLEFKRVIFVLSLSFFLFCYVSKGFEESISNPLVNIIPKKTALTCFLNASQPISWMSHQLRLSENRVVLPAGL